MLSNRDSNDEDDISPRVKLSASTIYDESVDVVDAEEVQSVSSSNSSNINDVYCHTDSPPTPVPYSNSDSFHNAKLQEASTSGADTADHRASHLSSSRRVPVRHNTAHSDNSEDDDDDEDDEDEDEDDDDVQAATLEGSYDPSEFEHLPVAADIKELFQNITRYTPQKVELDFKLQPFLPEFIPAAGDIDAFLKVPRPDGQSDGTGLHVLDEPCACQSEPAVLHLQLRAVAKQSSGSAVVVKKVENAEKNSRAIDKWIKDISDLHLSKPPPTVHYTKPMPDIDNLMQEWPAEFEQQLQEIGLPTADLDCNLLKYVDIICNFFDIPIYESRIQSLHVLFSLYAAVKKHVNNNPV
ncbi:intraflagellar transport protein 46 homolog isoform X1 [Schistocerca americana]|uniref:intraflagellar transport protein 46 homolog isoform X1 n=1 Tax=Schistocerca americana TaxID=7009 RepID=UPI001F4F8C72|nr:intraflagellar transport protein 46 homolog isoform X1 [Schistocerca americana]